MHVATDADADSTLQSRLTEPTLNKRAFLLSIEAIEVNSSVHLFRGNRMRQERQRNLLMLFLLGGFPLLLINSTVLAKPGLLDSGRKTLGGSMAFSDEVVYQGWRIQKHAVIE